MSAIKLFPQGLAMLRTLFCRLTHFAVIIITLCCHTSKKCSLEEPKWNNVTDGFDQEQSIALLDNLKSLMVSKNNIDGDSAKIDKEFVALFNEIIKNTNKKQFAISQDAQDILTKVRVLACDIQSGLFDANREEAIKAYLNIISQLDYKKKVVGSALFKIVEVDTLQTITVRDTVEDFVYLNGEYADLGIKIDVDSVDPNYKKIAQRNAPQIYTTKRSKIKVRLHVINMFSDSRPILIRKITIKQHYLCKSEIEFWNCGAGYNKTPTYPGSDIFESIPILEPITIDERGSFQKFDYLKQKQITINPSKHGTIDFVFETQRTIRRLNCVKQFCNTCASFREDTFYPDNVIIEFVSDKPDISDPDGMLFGVRDILSVLAP